MLPKPLATLLLFILALVNIQAQPLPDSITRKIDDLFKRWNSPNSPGCTIGIIRNDSLIYAKGYGMANLEYGIPNKPETIYHMASVSKQFTAYAIVLLARDGKVNLDDDVRKYLTWFPDLKEKITIRQLLNHTSGIRDQWQLLAMSGTRLDDVITQEHIIKLLERQQALNSKPGEMYNYSNSGFTMLAEIVKTVSGQTLRQFTDSAIFRPLKMNNTHFHDNYTEVVKNRSYSYRRLDSARFANAVLSYSVAGATSLFTNIPDMAKWVTNFYQPKAGSFIEINQLVEKGRLNNGKDLNYALGIIVNNYKGLKEYTHSGGDAGYATYLTVFPDLKMGFMVFSNIGEINPGGKTYEMVDLVLGNTKSNKPAPAKIDTGKAILADTKNIAKFSGHYLSDLGVQFRFTLRDKRLYWDRGGMSDLLAKTDKDTFALLVAPEVKFIFKTGNNRDTMVEQYWPDGQRMLSKYQPAEGRTEKQLQDYTGMFYSPELDSKYGIVLKNQQLWLTNNKYPDTRLTVIHDDLLLSNLWWMGSLKMLRDNNSRITGFEVNSGRVLHLRFDKIQ